jgi:hypothetical protein
MLDDLLPAPHFRERHRRRIAAPPDAVWAALHEVRLADSALARVLMNLRALPLRLNSGHHPRLVAGRFLEDGPLSFTAEPERIVVGGGLLQPWKLRGGKKAPQLNGRALRAFNEPGWVKCAIDFVLEPHEDGTTLRTETRVRATDRRTWLRFAPYWFLIRPGSGLVRRGLLRAVARRAEAAA